MQNRKKTKQHLQKQSRRLRRQLLTAASPVLICLAISMLLVGQVLFRLYRPTKGPVEFAYADSWWEGSGRYGRNLVVETSEGAKYRVVGFFSKELQQDINAGSLSPGDRLTAQLHTGLLRDQIVALSSGKKTYATVEDHLALCRRNLSQVLVTSAVLTGLGLALSIGFFLLDSRELRDTLRLRRKYKARLQEDETIKKEHK